MNLAVSTACFMTSQIMLNHDVILKMKTWFYFDVFMHNSCTKVHIHRLKLLYNYFLHMLVVIGNKNKIHYEVNMKDSREFSVFVIYFTWSLAEYLLFMTNRITVKSTVIALRYQWLYWIYSHGKYHDLCSN